MSDYFVHESCFIDDGVQIGRGTKIWHFSHVMPRSVIGKDCNIGQNVSISSDVIVGNNVKVQNNVSIYTGVLIEDDVFLGPSMVFTNVLNPRSHVSRKHEYRRTLVKQGASIGANATIVCGVTIGRYAFVGAGAVVTSDVPDYTLVFGNPARVKGWICQCGIKLDWNLMQNGKAARIADPNNGHRHELAICESCGSQYIKHGRDVKSVETVGVV